MQSMMPLWFIKLIILSFFRYAKCLMIAGLLCLEEKKKKSLYTYIKRNYQLETGCYRLLMLTLEMHRIPETREEHLEKYLRGFIYLFISAAWLS